jgi:uncharacterized protein YdcH (DUF465 family)
VFKKKSLNEIGHKIRRVVKERSLRERFSLENMAEKKTKVKDTITKGKMVFQEAWS